MRISRLRTTATLILVCIIGFGTCISAYAGIRGPGKYSGVVVFDRWDTCLLLDGLYVMYISNDAKEQLREYADSAVEIYATHVFQPVNPGDGLISEYAVTSPNQGRSSNLRLEVADDFKRPGTPAFVVTIRNRGPVAAEIAKSQIGVTLLGSNYEDLLFSSPSNGRSVAWITRTGLIDGYPDKSPSKEWGLTSGRSTVSWKYTEDPSCAGTDSAELASGKSLSCRLEFSLPVGHYELILGYSQTNRRPIVSNGISFRVTDEGLAILE